MAEGRWEDEVIRISYAVWGKPGEMLNANPHRMEVMRPVTKRESDEAFRLVGAMLGQINAGNGVTSG